MRLHYKGPHLQKEHISETYFCQLNSVITKQPKSDSENVWRQWRMPQVSSSNEVKSAIFASTLRASIFIYLLGLLQETTQLMDPVTQPPLSWTQEDDKIKVKEVQNKWSSGLFDCHKDFSICKHSVFFSHALGRYSLATWSSTYKRKNDWQVRFQNNCITNRNWSEVDYNTEAKVTSRPRMQVNNGLQIHRDIKRTE